MLQDKTANGQTSDQSPLIHGWQKEAPDLLSRAWFYKELPGILDRLRQVGREQGVTADVTFFHNPDPTEYRPETIAMFAVDSVQVPYFLRLELQWPDELSLAQLEEALTTRLHEVIQGHDILLRRSKAMRRAADESVRRIGHGAVLSRLVLEPIMFDGDEPTVGSQQHIAEIDLLQDDLKSRPEKHMVGHPAEITEFYKPWERVQENRAAAIHRRAERPGEIEGESMALCLLHLAKIAPKEIAALEPRSCVQPPSPLVVEGAELKNVQFFLLSGRISVRFDFQGGYYHGSSIILHETLPDLVQDALIGKPLNEVISGGIFDVINPKITGLGSLLRGTKLKLEPLNLFVSLNGPTS